VGGLQHHRTWLGLSPKDQELFDYITRDQPHTVYNATWWDIAPPDPFLIVLEHGDASAAHAVKFGTDAAAFFGSGGVEAPAGDVVFRYGERFATEF
jgi:hypothetical protein